MGLREGDLLDDPYETNQSKPDACTKKTILTWREWLQVH
jgi:hypothetical protein